MVELVHVIETLGSGGAERVLHTNLANLDRTRFHSSVVVLRGRESDHWWAPISALDVPVETLGVRSRLDLPGAVLTLSKLLSQRKAGLVHTHLWEANVVGRLAGRLASVPVISSIHAPDYEPTAWEGRQGHATKRRFFLTLDRWTANLGCARMIAVSEHVRRSAHVHLRVPLERIDLVYNPVDLAELRRPATRSRSTLLAEIGLPADALVLLSVARLSPQKGLNHAIDALSQILKSNEHVHLVSVGALDDVVWVDSLKRQCADRGVTRRVHFLGPRRDVPDLLRACDLFLFPSLFEGLGLALIEAMAAGCVCVSADIDPIREIVKEGIDGWLVPPGDDAALARAVVRALDGSLERTRLREAAADSVTKRFDPQLAAQSLQAVYDRVLE